MIVTGESSFTLSIKKWVEKTNADISKTFRTVCMNIFADIVRAWPVDTGRSRAAWQITLNSPGVGETGFTPGASTYGEGGNRDENAGRATAHAMEQTNKLAGLKAEDVCYINNNVRYAIYLEYGHSKQAPRGVVRLTLDKYRKSLSLGGPPFYTHVLYETT